MDEEWILVAGLFALPAAIFAAFETTAFLRRRTERARASRSKAQEGKGHRKK